MKALRNILSDILFQFRLRGGLFARVSCVAHHYYYYGRHRLAGLGRDESRGKAWEDMTRAGFSAKMVALHWPAGMITEIDVVAASFMVKEMFSESMYEKLPDFAPREGWTVVDVGSHQGTFTLPAAARVGKKGRVIAVEALPANAERLRRNVSRNGLDQVAIVGMAASDAPGRAALHVLGGNTSSSLVMTPEGSPEITVAVETLDHILEKEKAVQPDLIKIDVEGACLKVLQGARNTLAKGPRLVMEVEFGPEEIAKVVRFVEERGYRCQVMDNIIYAVLRASV